MNLFKFCVYALFMQYIKGITSYCKYMDEQETTKNLRTDLDSRYEEMHATFKEQRDIDLREKQELNEKIEDLEGQIQRCQKFIDKFQEDAQAKKGQSMKDLLAGKIDENQHGLELGEIEIPSDEKDPSVSEPRMFTIEQLKELFYINLNCSEVRTRLYQTDNQIEKCQIEMSRLEEQDKKLMTLLDNRMIQVDKHFEKNEKQASEAQEYIDARIMELKHHFGKHSDNIFKLQEFQKESIKFQEKTRNDQDRTQKRIDSMQTNIHQDIQTSQDVVLQQLRDLESRNLERFRETDDTIGQKERALRELIEYKDGRLNDTLSKGINDINAFVKNVADELHAKRTELNAKYTRKFSKVKDVIAKYFEKYDVDMEELKINMKVLNQKYADWSRVLIEPTSLNEARLYALETRLHEEEETRIKEQEFVRDTVKKLIFSLEQTSLQNIDSVQQLSSRKPQNESPTQIKVPALPNLLITSTGQSTSKHQSFIEPQKSSQEMSTSLQTRTNEILMLKRLNYLKNSLESHSPRQTSNNIRLKSMQKRDNRVVDMWKREMEAPSVQDILQVYLKNRPSNQVANELKESVEEGGVQMESLMDSSLLAIADAQLPSSTGLMIKAGENQANLLEFNIIFANFLTEVPNQPEQQQVLQLMNQSFDSVGLSKPEPIYHHKTKKEASLADKINRSKFVTPSDQLLLDKQAQPSRNNPYDTFWSVQSQQQQHVVNNFQSFGETNQINRVVMREKSQENNPRKHIVRGHHSNDGMRIARGNLKLQSLKRKEMLEDSLHEQSMISKQGENSAII